MPVTYVIHARRNEAFSICFPIPPLTGAEFIESIGWTPIAGDIKLILDDADPVNPSSLPSYVGNKVWGLDLTASEMDASVINVVISRPLLFQDVSLIIQTNLMSLIPKGTPPNWNKVARTTDIEKYVKQKGDPRNGR